VSAIEPPWAFPAACFAFFSAALFGLAPADFWRCPAAVGGPAVLAKSKLILELGLALGVFSCDLREAEGSSELNVYVYVFYLLIALPSAQSPADASGCSSSSRS
jgi:hypothetical protein